MDSKVAALAATSDPTFGQKPTTPPRSPPESTADRAAQGQDPADMRLVIEEDKASGSYVYKTVNRVTGEVVQQLPREQVLQLKEQVDYVAGNVVRTKA
jgi:flagellar protein FlaG